MRKSITWSLNEDQLILENFSLIKSKKWKIISNLLKQQGYEKKETQCRQRYINHLAPCLDKNKQISAEQLELFYKKYEQYGPKWTLIQQFLPNKSQVQLKNIFYGNIRCFVKKIIKYFTNKTSVFVNRLDTFTLQNIYSGKRSKTSIKLDYRSLNFLKEDIRKMGYRFDQDECFSLIQANESSYQELFKTLLEQNQAKKSKHYEHFRKLYAKKNHTQIDIINRSKNSEEDNQVNQLQIQKKHSHLLQIESESEIEHKNKLIAEFQPSKFQIPNWNENQYFYLGEQSAPNQGTLSFFSPQMDFSFQNHVAYQFYMNNWYYDNLNFQNGL